MPALFRYSGGAARLENLAVTRTQAGDALSLRPSMVPRPGSAGGASGHTRKTSPMNVSPPTLITFVVYIAAMILIGFIAYRA
ncbi:hypothetical protein, partial [Stutzerimonas stutzeri]|uniref:hypothetical protein n=1 Tax=Stutzerimonas stutzeri TaxID=316 RepID=UPI00222FDB51